MLSEKERRLQQLECMVNYEKAQKYPEDTYPRFHPDLAQSQEIVSGRQYRLSSDREGKCDSDGFSRFLKEDSVWKMRKDKKIRDLQTEVIQKEIEDGLYKPRISLNSQKIWEHIKHSNGDENC